VFPKTPQPSVKNHKKLGRYFQNEITVRKNHSEFPTRTQNSFAPSEKARKNLRREALKIHRRLKSTRRQHYIEEYRSSSKDNFSAG
jgi:hypothetical protein